MNQLTTIAALPGSGGGRVSEMRRDVARARLVLTDEDSARGGYPSGVVTSVVRPQPFVNVVCSVEATAATRAQIAQTMSRYMVRDDRQCYRGEELIPVTAPRARVKMSRATYEACFLARFNEDAGNYGSYGWSLGVDGTMTVTMCEKDAVAIRLWEFGAVESVA